MQIIIADDQELYRVGIVLLVQDTFPDSRIIQTDDVSQILDWSAKGVECDLLLIDLHMSGVEHPRNLKLLCDVLPHTNIVVVSADETQESVFEALKAGARGYIFKSFRSDQIKLALQRVMQGELYLPQLRSVAPGARHSALIESLCERLTERQQAVLHQLLAGKSNREIGLALKIAESTVKVHLSVIYDALDVHSRAEALAKLAS